MELITKRDAALSLPKGYKQTEVGVIPEDWDVIRFEEKFQILVGGDVDLSSFSVTQDSKYKYPIYANSVTNKGLYGYSSKNTFEGESLTAMITILAALCAIILLQILRISKKIEKLHKQRK